MSFYNSINLDFGCPIDRIDRISVFLYFKILLTSGPIWFSVAVIIPKGLEEVYNFLRESTSTLISKISPGIKIIFFA